MCVWGGGGLKDNINKNCEELHFRPEHRATNFIDAFVAYMTWYEWLQGVLPLIGGGGGGPHHTN